VRYEHVDVFAENPFHGNSLPVFLDAGHLDAAQMLAITQELRHFEAIFLRSTSDPGTWRARIFDMFTELPFAGHPVIGAAAVLHHRAASSNEDVRTWRFELPGRTVTVKTRRRRDAVTSAGDGCVGELDQGEAEFGCVVEDRARVARAFALDVDDLRADLPLQVVSTGLRYLVVPVRAGALNGARVLEDLTGLVVSVGAQFAVLFDEDRLEVRHWNNDGVVEDIATGSAAGTIGAYRLRHGLAAAGVEFDLHQGNHLGRPSVLRVRAHGTPEHVENVSVAGAVAMVGHGVLHVPVPGSVDAPGERAVEVGA
jgi:PhzF family phenazine biosynthesis protein